MTTFALGLWLLGSTGQTTPLLLTTFFAELPGLVAGSLAGVLVDRWDRRYVLILADAGQAIGTLLLLASVLSGTFELWHLYAIVLVQGTFAVFQQTARDASTTMLIHETHRERANAIQQMAFPLAGIIGTATTGVLYGAIGLPGVLFIDLLTVTLAVLALLGVRIPRPRATEEGDAIRGNVWRGFSGAVRFLAGRPALLGLVLYGIGINFLQYTLQSCRSRHHPTYRAASLACAHSWDSWGRRPLLRWSDR